MNISAPGTGSSNTLYYCSSTFTRSGRAPLPCQATSPKLPTPFPFEAEVKDRSTLPDVTGTEYAIRELSASPGGGIWGSEHDELSSTGKLGGLRSSNR